MIPDGGFNVDAGWQPYNGTEEPGVVCGANTCNADGDGGSCCIGLLSGMSACAAMCQQFDLPAACDGPEDCGGTTICCFKLLGGGAQCTEPAMCMGAGGATDPVQVCNVTADCPAGSGCCQSATLSGYLPGLAVGACVVGCNL